MKSSLSLFIILFCFTLNLTAQSVNKIRLLDLASSLPISGATFQYGEQRGISDKDGAIEFHFLDGVSMHLSQIVYGEWQLSYADLKSAIKTGFVFWEIMNFNLYPFTVIAMHPKT